MSALPGDMLVVLCIGFGLGILCSESVGRWWGDRKKRRVMK